MGRIRTIKPDFFLDTDLAELPIEARYLFIGLWTQADRKGRMEDNPRRLHAQIFPWDQVDTENLLSKLAPRFITRYEVAGRRFLAINTFEKHQRPHLREAPSTIPSPSSAKAQPRLCLGTALAVPSPLDKGKGMDKGKGREGVIATPSGAAKEKTPVQRVVEAYKLAKKVPMDDKGWDRQNFGRYAKAAKSLLEKFAGDVNAAAAYLFVRGLHFDEHGLEWTLETIARNAWDGAGIKTQGDDDGQQSGEVGADRVLGQGRGRGTSSAGSLVGDTLRAIESTAVRAEETPDLAEPEHD